MISSMLELKTISYRAKCNDDTCTWQMGMVEMFSAKISFIVNLCTMNLLNACRRHLGVSSISYRMPTMTSSNNIKKKSKNRTSCPASWCFDIGNRFEFDYYCLLHFCRMAGTTKQKQNKKVLSKWNSTENKWLCIFFYNTQFDGIRSFQCISNAGAMLLFAIQMYFFFIFRLLHYSLTVHIYTQTIAH